MQYKSLRRFALIILNGFAFSLLSAIVALAHPLGNFTINHYSRLQIASNRLTLRYVVDMAEIPAFQELQRMDTNNDGKQSAEELQAYAEQAAARYREGLRLTIDGTPHTFLSSAARIETREGAGGLPTLRLECDFVSDVKANAATQRLIYEDTNDGERLGWREIVVMPGQSVAIYDSTAFGSGLTDELQGYPEDRLAAPLNERRAELSFTTAALPVDAKALQTREGRPIMPTRDRFAELITVKELTLPVALLGLLIASALGGVHAMSPGHGKTIVGAYLVGSRGTVKHAAFLGLTVTITHTLGVIALGVATLIASSYFLPEKLFPIISLLSGLIVVILGITLFYQRLRAALGRSSHHAHDHHDHTHSHHDHNHSHHSHEHHQSHEPHEHPHSHDVHNHTHETHDHHHEPAHTHSHTAHTHHERDHHEHSHSHDDELRTPNSELRTLTHTHDGHTHSHALPDDTRITWRSLLALGISGGLLPCPSALVVMLSAITMNRIGYGLLLVVAFSIGLAATLTGIGLLFLYAGRFLKRTAGIRENRLVKLLPVLSALVITLVGVAICYQALLTNGFRL